jgi:hypothetical protein
MAPIRRFRRQPPKKEAVQAEMGFRALSLLDGNAPTGEPQPLSAMHLPRPEGEIPAGDSSRPAAAKADIGLTVQPVPPAVATLDATRAPIRKFKRRQKKKMAVDGQAGLGFEGLSLFAGSAPAGMPQPESGMHLPWPEGKMPAGESSKMAAAPAEIGLMVEPEALSLLAGIAAAFEVASKSSNPPPKPTVSSARVETMGLKRVEPEAEPTKHRSPPQAEDVDFEMVASQEKDHQPPSPPVRFETPPVGGKAPAGKPQPESGMQDRSPLLTQDQETADGLLKQIDDTVGRIMEFRRCKMQQDQETDSLFEMIRDALKRTMAFRSGRSNDKESVEPSPLPEQEVIRCLTEEAKALEASFLAVQETDRIPSTFLSVTREVGQAVAAARETKSTASVMALRSALDKRVKIVREFLNHMRRQVDQSLSLRRRRREFSLASAVEAATPAAGAVGLKRYPLLFAMLPQMEEEEREMLERCWRDVACRWMLPSCRC